MNPLQLVVLQGIPASGKSTWAKEFLLKDDNSESWIRVCRDDIRRMLGKYWIPSREDFVSDIEESTVRQALTDGYDVIIDATNLNPITIKKWEDLVEYYNANIKKHNYDSTENMYPECVIKYKFFPITPEEAIVRDSKRGEESVGEKVITNFWRKYVKGKLDTEYYLRTYMPRNLKLRDCIIVDIDGTVALMNGRSPYDHTRVSEDLPNNPVIGIVREYAYNEYPNKVIFVSGRTEDCREDTKNWIDKHIFIPKWGHYPHVGYELYMRPANDYRKDEIIKDEIYKQHILDKYNVLFVLDDRDKVVKYWRSQGLLCLQVYEGDF